jgi:hypothetical protein
MFGVVGKQGKKDQGEESKNKPYCSAFQRPGIKRPQTEISAA